MEQKELDIIEENYEIVIERLKKDGEIMRLFGHDVDLENPHHVSLVFYYLGKSDGRRL